MALSPRSDVLTLDPSQIPLWVSGATVSQYFQVAVTTVLVYHTIITIDKEIKYFWGARLNLVTVAYFANRYIGIFGALSNLLWYRHGVSLSLCNFSLWTSNIAVWLTIIVIDYILMIRVLALYSQARHLARALRILLGLEAIIGLVILIYSTVIEDVVVVSLGPESPTECGEDQSSPLLTPLGIVSWATPLVYGVILMALALYKATEYWRMSSGLKGFTLVKVLIVDQVIYFGLAVSCCLLQIMNFKLIISNVFVSDLVNSLGSPTFLCVMGSIMLFNLKEAGERGLNHGTSYRLRSVSAMEFA